MPPIDPPSRGRFNQSFVSRCLGGVDGELVDVGEQAEVDGGASAGGGRAVELVQFQEDVLETELELQGLLNAGNDCMACDRPSCRPGEIIAPVPESGPLAL